MAVLVSTKNTYELVQESNQLIEIFRILVPLQNSSVGKASFFPVAFQAQPALWHFGQ